jgi:hypothetical protein
MRNFLLSQHSKLDVAAIFSCSLQTMKKLILAVLAGVALVGAGCVHTVNDSHTGALWFGNDKFQGRYERSVDEVYQAAYKVVTGPNQNGVVVAEYIPHESTNSVKSFEARVENRKVWVRVESVSLSPEVSGVTVQARTLHGTRDELLAHELEKEIALALVPGTH